MNPDERDDLWHLLGKAKPAEPSPFFSRNVLRAVRESEPQSGSVIGWLVAHWKVGIVAGCTVAVAAFAILPLAEREESIELLAEEVSESPDYAVIGQLDELLASEESSVWLDHVY